MMLVFTIVKTRRYRSQAILESVFSMHQKHFHIYLQPDILQAGVFLLDCLLNVVHLLQSGHVYPAIVFEKIQTFKSNGVTSYGVVLSTFASTILCSIDKVIEVMAIAGGLGWQCHRSCFVDLGSFFSSEVIYIFKDGALDLQRQVHC